MQKTNIGCEYSPGHSVWRNLAPAFSSIHSLELNDTIAVQRCRKLPEQHEHLRSRSQRALMCYTFRKACFHRRQTLGRLPLSSLLRLFISLVIEAILKDSAGNRWLRFCFFSRGDLRRSRNIRRMGGCELNNQSNLQVHPQGMIGIKRAFQMYLRDMYLD